MIWDQNSDEILSSTGFLYTTLLKIIIIGNKGYGKKAPPSIAKDEIVRMVDDGVHINMDALNQGSWLYGVKKHKEEGIYQGLCPRNIMRLIIATPDDFPSEELIQTGSAEIAVRKERHRALENKKKE